MTSKEKALILFALSALADKLNIKENELITTENLTNKFNKILEENKCIFNNRDILQQELSSMVKKYINKLSDNKNNKKQER